MTALAFVVAAVLYCGGVATRAGPPTPQDLPSSALQADGPANDAETDWVVLESSVGLKQMVLQLTDQNRRLKKELERTQEERQVFRNETRGLQSQLEYLRSIVLRKEEQLARLVVERKADARHLMAMTVELNATQRRLELGVCQSGCWKLGRPKPALHSDNLPEHGRAGLGSG